MLSTLFKDALGTCVLFEEGPQKGMTQIHTFSVYCCKLYLCYYCYVSFLRMFAGKAASDPELKYICHTVKKLTMQRIFLTEKKEGETLMPQLEQPI